LIHQFLECPESDRDLAFNDDLTAYAGILRGVRDAEKVLDRRLTAAVRMQEKLRNRDKAWNARKKNEGDEESNPFTAITRTFMILLLSLLQSLLTLEATTRGGVSPQGYE
jgi:hypothetical protein